MTKRTVNKTYQTKALQVAASALKAMTVAKQTKPVTFTFAMPK